MARLFEIDFEGGTPGATIASSVHSSVDYVRNAPTYTSTAAVGSVGMECVVTTATDRYVRALFGGLIGTVYTRMYVQRVSTGAFDFARLVVISPAAVRAIARFSATGQVAVTNQSGTQVGAWSTATVAADEWVRFEWMVTQTTQRFRLYIGDNMHGATPDYDSGDMAWTAAGTFDNLNVGSVSAFANVTVRHDAVAADDTAWIGSAVDEEPPPAATLPLHVGAQQVTRAYIGANEVTVGSTPEAPEPAGLGFAPLGTSPLGGTA